MTSSRKNKARERTERDDPEQSRAFIEKARELQADQDDAAADELMKRLAHKKPEPHLKK